MSGVLDVLDIVAITVYFLLVMAAGLYAMCSTKRSTVSGYFLAGRYMTWLPVGASMFASNIGSEHFIGLAGSGAAAGIAVGAFEFNALLLLQVLGWIFLPVYIASKVSTLPEYMSKRFGGHRIQIFLAILSLILYIFTKISVNMYAGALFINHSLGWNIYLSIILLLTMTALCTVTGGLAAVIYTDTIQCFVMLAGGAILMVTAFSKVGGYSALKTKYMEAIPSVLINGTTCGHPRADSWSMLRHPVNSDMPWPGFILGQTPASIWYWCADQMMVQRALAAKSISHAQGATLFTGYVKILPIFMMVLPGMISRVLYTDMVACVDPDECLKYCGSRLGCSNLAYPQLVTDLLPHGLRGVMLAVMLAALMSDLTSIFNSSSTLFVMDVWKYIRKHSAPRELLIVGKLFVMLMVVISIVWIPIIIQMQGGQLYLYIQMIAAYLSPPIAAVYLLAVLWKRMNEKGAFWALAAGFFVGAFRMCLDFYYREPACGEPDLRPEFVTKIHYMYFATILFWQTIVISVIVSLITPPPPSAMLIRTTYWTRFDKKERKDEYQVDLQEVNGYLKGIVDSNHCCQEDLPAVLFKEGPIIEQQKVGITDRSDEILLKPMKFADENNSTHGHVPVSLNGVCENHEMMPDVENGPQTKPKSFPQRLCGWFCGFQDHEHHQNEAATFAAHLEELASLQQNPKAKIFLNVNLAIIIVVGVSLYTFFSLDSFL